jgi:hypothetical protein
VRMPRAPTVAMVEARPLLLGHHSSDGTVAIRLWSIDIERCIVVVGHLDQN